MNPGYALAMMLQVAIIISLIIYIVSLRDKNRNLTIKSNDYFRENIDLHSYMYKAFKLLVNGYTLRGNNSAVRYWVFSSPEDEHSRYVLSDAYDRLEMQGKLNRYGLRADNEAVDKLLKKD